MDRFAFLGWMRLATVLSGALCLFLLPIAGLVWLSRDLAPPQGSVIAPPGPETVDLASLLPDLPRPRPIEPLYTGSIGRGADPVVQSGLRPASVIGGEFGVDGGWRPAKRRSAGLPDEAAVTACEDSVREGLPLPTELFRVVASTAVYRAPGEDAVVVFAFDTFNGLRFPLSLQVQCVFDGMRLARLEVSPR